MLENATYRNSYSLRHHQSSQISTCHDLQSGSYLWRETGHWRRVQVACWFVLFINASFNFTVKP
jgi:hypothetical protein